MKVAREGNVVSPAVHRHIVKALVMITNNVFSCVSTRDVNVIKHLDLHLHTSFIVFCTKTSSSNIERLNEKINFRWTF